MHREYDKDSQTTKSPPYLLPTIDFAAHTSVCLDLFSSRNVTNVGSALKPSPLYHCLREEPSRPDVGKRELSAHLVDPAAKPMQVRIRDQGTAGLSQIPFSKCQAGVDVHQRLLLAGIEKIARIDSLRLPSDFLFGNTWFWEGIKRCDWMADLRSAQIDTA